MGPMRMSHDSTPASPLGGSYRLGGRSVARIGYGAMQLRHLERDPAAAIALVRRAIELGVNHIDTAQFYGNGFVNGILREAVRPGDGVVIASKVGADPNPGAPVPIRLAQRPEQLKASVEANLASLGLEQIPLVNLRRTDSGRVVAEGDQIVDLDDQIAALVALRDEGKIGAIGLSAIDLDQLRRAATVGIACVQNAYSLVSKQFEDMRLVCRDNAIAWVPFFPLGGAMADMPKVTDQAAVVAIATRMAVTPAQVGLAWLLQSAANTLLISGTVSIAHLAENCAVGSIVLDEAAMAELDALRLAALPHASH